MKRFSKILSALLAVILLCSALPAFAENQAAASADEAARKAMDDITAFYRQNEENRELADPDAANSYCGEIFRYMAENNDLTVFHGSAEEDAAFLLELRQMIYGGDGMSTLQINDAAVFYVAVWTVMHLEGTANKSRPYLKTLMAEQCPVLSAETVNALVDRCVDYILEAEPDIAEGSLTVTSTEDTITGNDGYIRYVQEGTQLFEQRRYEEAVTALRKALEYKPHDINASFELVEACLALNRLDEAEAELMVLLPYITEDEDKAHWLRRYGYIATECMYLDLAYCLYKYSQTLYESDLAENEMGYIRYLNADIPEYTAAGAAEYLRMNFPYFEHFE